MSRCAAARPQQIVVARRRRQVIARRARRPRDRPPMALPSRPRAISSSAGSRVLSGIWTARQPPCGSASSRRRSTAGWSGTHWNTAFANSRSVSAGGLQRARSPSSNARPGKPLARLPQHVGRGIEPDHLGLRVARDQELGGIAGPAAEIVDPPRRRQRHLREQITRRPRALVLELEILAGVPTIGHDDTSASVRTSCI